ncbi:hypothetical protein F4780DRAFT_236785 [Xylariomycetidae sp. FL0641]|nr:hypothetical protein F4780DRAFT_236785 [Xylariomycetidae sp. FL0641]
MYCSRLSTSHAELLLLLSNTTCALSRPWRLTNVTRLLYFGNLDFNVLHMAAAPSPSQQQPEGSNDTSFSIHCVAAILGVYVSDALEVISRDRTYWEEAAKQESPWKWMESPPSEMCATTEEISNLRADHLKALKGVIEVFEFYKLTDWNNLDQFFEALRNYLQVTGIQIPEDPFAVLAQDLRHLRNLGSINAMSFTGRRQRRP